jgi:glutathione S-transferase
MKIYDYRGAPNPKRLRVYLAEKGLSIPFEEVDIVAGATRRPEFRAINPMGGLPVLELDDGRRFSESLAIIEYFEELHPEPPMIGTTAEERLRVRQLERMCEIGVLLNVAMVAQNTTPFFAPRVKQSADAAEMGRKRLMGTLKVLDREIGERPFIAGAAPTICDCTLLSAIGFSRLMSLEIDLSTRPNVARWYEEFKKRPSAKA